MSCASCVSRVEQALQKVPGVSPACVNLGERSTLVPDTTSPAALIDSVEQASYFAEVIEDEKTRRKRQQVSTQQTMRRFSWQSALAFHERCAMARFLPAAGRRATSTLKPA